MKPLQVYLDESDLARLDSWARERGWTKSEAIRAAVRALTRGPDEDPLLSLSGIMQDRLPPDCSERFGQYLQETFVAESTTTYRRRPVRRRTPRSRR